MIKSFYDLNYKIFDPMSIQFTHVHCAPVSCPWYPRSGIYCQAYMPKFKAEKKCPCVPRFPRLNHNFLTCAKAEI